jgi:PadR family transcriptional regulator PadR
MVRLSADPLPAEPLNLEPLHLTPKWNNAIFTGMAGKETPVELLQGTLDLIVLRALSTMGPLHAYALATRLAQVSDHPLSLNQGTLYPALVRLEQKGWIKGDWQKTENNRDAKYYALTRSGSRALAERTERWRRIASLVDKLLATKSLIPNR